MKLTTGYKKPIASSGTDALELSSNNSYLLLAGGGHKALSELVSPADLTTELSNYVTIGSNQTITGVKTFSLAINADITGNASTATNIDWSGVTNKPISFKPSSHTHTTSQITDFPSSLPANGGNADTLDGKQASDFMLKSEHKDYEEVTSVALNDLDSRKADKIELTNLDERKVDKVDDKGLSTNDYTNDDKVKLAGIEAGAQKHIAPTADEVKNALGYTPADKNNLVDYSVSVSEQGASGDVLKSYVLTQNGSTIGTISIPKDLVVSSGSVVVGNWVDGVFTENASGTGKAIKLVISNLSDPIYINVQDLSDVYTVQQGATEVQLAISGTNEISATLVKAVRDKIDNAIPKVSGATGKVAQFKADGSLESSSFELKKSVPADAVFTDTTYSIATSDTLGLVKIGYSENGKNYPVQLSNGQMYVNVPWTDTNTWRPITDSYLGTSSDTSLSQKGGKDIYDTLVNGYATNAGNAGTLNGHTADDFVLKTTHDVYESVIVESLNDLDNRKIEISDLPTSLPANGGHADTATNVDWSGVTNKPSSLPANGGNADTINGYSSSDFVLNTNYGEFKSIVATALTDLDSRKIDKEDGKGLSTNDYTTDEKNKLVGIEEGAQVNDPNTVIDANYVHTDNNYTTTEKNKLSGIETGALVNTVNSVAGKTGNVTLNVSNIGGLQSALDGKQDNLEFTSAPSSNNKVVTQNELNSAITGQSSYLGTIESISSLPTTAKKGDFYRIKTAWSGVHVGDLIIAEKDNPVAIIDEVNWSLLHNEMDTDTTYTFEDGIDGFSVTPSVGNKQKVNISVGYATSAGNAETLDGKNADDFVQNITIGSVITGAPGSKASVTASKINSDVTLNFTIPRGANGNMYELEDDNGGTNVSDLCEVSRVWLIFPDPNLIGTFADKIQVPVPSIAAMVMAAACIKQKADILLNVGEEIIKSQYTWKELHWLLRCSNTDCIVYTTKYATPHGGAAQYPSINVGGNTQYPPNIIEISVSYDKNIELRYVQVTIENMYGRAYYMA